MHGENLKLTVAVV